MVGWLDCVVFRSWGLRDVSFYRGERGWRIEKSSGRIFRGWFDRSVLEDARVLFLAGGCLGVVGARQLLGIPGCGDVSGMDNQCRVRERWGPTGDDDGGMGVLRQQHRVWSDDKLFSIKTFNARK